MSKLLSQASNPTTGTTNKDTSACQHCSFPTTCHAGKRSNGKRHEFCQTNVAALLSLLIGLVALIAICAGIGYFIYWRRKRHQQRRDVDEAHRRHENMSPNGKSRLSTDMEVVERHGTLDSGNIDDVVCVANDVVEKVQMRRNECEMARFYHQDASNRNNIRGVQNSHNSVELTEDSQISRNRKSRAPSLPRSPQTTTVQVHPPNASEAGRRVSTAIANSLSTPSSSRETTLSSRNTAPRPTTVAMRLPVINARPIDDEQRHSESSGNVQVARIRPNPRPLSMGMTPEKKKGSVITRRL